MKISTFTYSIDNGLKLETINSELGNSYIIKIIYCGVCGSDRNLVNGQRSTKENSKISIGHEIIGKVVKLPSEKSNHKTTIKLNDTILIYNILFCDKCKMCIAGIKRKCQLSIKIGKENPLKQLGGFSNYIALPPSLSHVYKIKKEYGLNPLYATIPCAGATAYSIFKNFNALNKAKSNVLIIGCGPLSLYLAFFFGDKHNVDLLTNISIPLDIQTLFKISRVECKSDLNFIIPRYSMIIDAKGDIKMLNILLSLDRIIYGTSILSVGATHDTPFINLDITNLTRKGLVLIGHHNYEPVELDESSEILLPFLNKNKHVLSKYISVVNNLSKSGFLKRKLNFEFRTFLAHWI